MSTNRQEVLKSFDLLSDVEKREVLSEIISRTLALNPDRQVAEGQLEALYASFTDEDRELAEEGVEDYARGLAGEDSE
jgi:hypothetical protein